MAGLTLAAYAVPVSMAYASLAGLPPHHGIYGYLFGVVVYAIFGTSRQLAIGPTSAIALLVGVSVAEMAGGDGSRSASIAALADVSDPQGVGGDANLPASQSSAGRLDDSNRNGPSSLGRTTS